MNLSYKFNLISRVFKSLAFRQMPNYAVVFIDGKCNMHCSFCCHAAVNVRKNPVMTPKNWGYIFKRAKSLMHLTITGGEPFLRKDFVDIIDNLIYSSGVPRISIKSNGFYVDRIKKFIPELIKKHKSTEFTLSISLDGFEEIHDKVRDFPGSFKKIKETLDVMKAYRSEENFFLRLASVLTKDNKDTLEDLLNETSGWPIDFHEVILVRDVPVSEQISLKEDYRKLSKLQHDRGSKNWRKSFNGKLFEKIYLETIKRIGSEKIHSPCLAGGRFIEVFPDGLVRGCEVEKMWDISKISHLGNNNNANGKLLDIVDVVKSIEAKKFRKIAKSCTCSFECANVINTVYDPKHWQSLL